MDTATAGTCSTAALPFTSSTIRKRHEAGSQAGLIFCHRCWLRCVSSTGWTNANASRGEYEVGLTNLFTSSVVLRTSCRSVQQAVHDYGRLSGHVDLAVHH